MACTDYGRQTTEAEERAHRGYSTAELIDAFCSACTALEEWGTPIPAAAGRVWAIHKRADEKRIQEANADEKLRQLKEAGLKKLTSAERDALGLRGES